MEQLTATKSIMVDYPLKASGGRLGLIQRWVITSPIAREFGNMEPKTEQGFSCTGNNLNIDVRSISKRSPAVLTAARLRVNPRLQLSEVLSRGVDCVPLDGGDAARHTNEFNLDAKPVWVSHSVSFEVPKNE
jgi:hypothetical protein